MRCRSFQLDEGWCSSLLTRGAAPEAVSYRGPQPPWSPRPRTRAFERAVVELHAPVLDAVLVAKLTGLRWGEQVALRNDEDVDFRRNKASVNARCTAAALRHRRRRSVSAASTRARPCGESCSQSPRNGPPSLCSRRTVSHRSVTGPGSSGSGVLPNVVRASKYRSPGTISATRFVSLLICAGKQAPEVHRAAGRSLVSGVHTGPIRYAVRNAANYPGGVVGRSTLARRAPYGYCSRRNWKEKGGRAGVRPNAGSRSRQRPSRVDDARHTNRG